MLALVGQEGPDRSPLGLGITALSLVVMPLLAWIEVRTGRELGSKSVMADAKQLILCIYLSGAVFIGLVLDSLFGWWWASMASGAWSWRCSRCAKAWRPGAATSSHRSKC